MDSAVAILLAVGIGSAGYFIGEGLKYGLVHFKSGKIEEKVSGDVNDILYDKLIKEDKIHTWLGISKEDAKDLIKKYPDIPHIELNGKIYYVKKGLNEWINDFNKKY
ncbi:hypothetical protein [Romboutsia sp.]|uniref:hypothetical protein n=1 Tax=Romboutsia sp. TaxID=1965302 RepID=UPI003F325593